MSRRAWIYVWTVLLAGVLLGGLALSQVEPSTPHWPAFLTLILLATIAQLFKVEAPNHQLYHVTLVFLFAGVLLLPPALFVPLVIIPHLIEWARERWQDTEYLRDWYLQPFNIAVHIIAGSLAGWIITTVRGYTFLLPASLLAIATGAFVYVLLNHGLIGVALALARGVPLNKSGILEFENLLTDFVLLCLGAIFATLWLLDPWLAGLAGTPLVLIYRALLVPQLKAQARLDSKTGLWNARYFLELYTSELERAKRFNRPLSLIMADLDLLRNINNTYGHLAGDAVLAGIGKIIRDNIRTYDIAGRFGGEEFAIVLPETDTTEVRFIAERIRQVVEDTGFEVCSSPTPISATLSLGTASFPDDATTPDELIHQADIAVYQAKLLGRNCVVRASEVPQHLQLAAVVPERMEMPHNFPFVPRPSAPAAHVNPVSTPPPRSVSQNGRPPSAQPTRD
ncbi:MAG: GGDEF domain-containing protein, partial [Chloroflexi bacterium]